MNALLPFMVAASLLWVALAQPKVPRQHHVTEYVFTVDNAFLEDIKGEGCEVKAQPLSIALGHGTRTWGDWQVVCRHSHAMKRGFE